MRQPGVDELSWHISCRRQLSGSTAAAPGGLGAGWRRVRSHRACGGSGPQLADQLGDADSLLAVVPASVAAFARATTSCGYSAAREGRWAIGSVGLLVHEQPLHTGGYVDLARGADMLAVAGTQVQVASPIDLIRIAGGDGFSRLRPFGAALWATPDMVRRCQRENETTGAVAATA